MTQLPTAPDLEHLRKQAKRLLRSFRSGESEALVRFRTSLPAARELTLARLVAQPYRLHDAQSVIARENGFRSWAELKRHVDWCRSSDAQRRARWLELVFSERAKERAAALRMLRQMPSLADGEAWLACIIGDETKLRAALAKDTDFADRPNGPFDMPPLAAVAASQLIWEPDFENGLLACARLLIGHGADVNGRWRDPRFPESPLSVLYGAAGRTHHPGMTKLLLDAGADPNDNESLYHSVESATCACTSLLLEAGARVDGTNAIARSLDYDRIDALRLLLAHGQDSARGRLIHHAIVRGRSAAHVKALLSAGADASETDHHGRSAYRLARLFGRDDLADLLMRADADEPLSEEEEFVAACSRADEAGARARLKRVPDIVGRLSGDLLKIMPQLAAIGRTEAVRTMLALGWPREITTGWQATALNLAIFVGDAEMSRILLEEGADWRTAHGYGGHALGTLSSASQADDVGEPAPRDYVGCAAALLTGGVPTSAFKNYQFSDEVQAFIDSWGDSDA
jgi:ankyrin repeat protein